MSEDEELMGTYAYYVSFYDGKPVPWWRRLWRWITRWKPRRYKVVKAKGTWLTLEREIEE